ncbi:putative membrane protein [Acorus calamus]|uniref:Membrane protein n=1 Tax=Acorus calamus TaxID=4465 RepID=A0AAV9CNR3_ACOCL|nr:putative membrane protein [Acorus calamus]
MEPPEGFWATLWSFLCFLPFFIGLLLLGIIKGLGYGFLAPLVATFDAVGEGKDNKFIHCIWLWMISAFKSLRLGKNVKSVGLLGVMGDMPVITMVALYKSPYMLFKGWHRLFHDLVGREGPFLETACVPFAGLAILLWPSAVTGAVLASIISSFFLGSYAAIVAYQENSISMGLSYIIASLSIYDEYSNDVLDMPEGSCFPRPPYRKNVSLRATSFSRHTSFNHDKRDGKAPLSRNMSLKNAITELKPIKLFEQLFVECKHYGESLIAEGMITITDVNECKSGKSGGGVISTGLPAYCILQTVLRSVSANSEGCNAFGAP